MNTWWKSLTRSEKSAMRAFVSISVIIAVLVLGIEVGQAIALF